MRSRFHRLFVLVALVAVVGGVAAVAEADPIFVGDISFISYNRGVSGTLAVNNYTWFSSELEPSPFENWILTIAMNPPDGTSPGTTHRVDSALMAGWSSGSTVLPTWIQSAFSDDYSPVLLEIGLPMPIASVSFAATLGALSVEGLLLPASGSGLNPDRMVGGELVGEYAALWATQAVVPEPATLWLLGAGLAAAAGAARRRRR